MTDAPTPSPPASLEEAMAGVVLADRYRLDGVLGEGGMALVFHGHHLGLDRAIAIKVLKPEFVADSQVRARFEQEARAVSRLEHAGIVKMYDVGTAEVPGLGVPIAFLVMERLRGVELSDLLRDDGPAPAPVALGWMEEMLAAIAHAHARGVVHRDLKPENVFACDSPEGGPSGGRVLKLVDFGIAKMVQPSGDAPLTQMGMIFGTPAYMSPEQATGQPIDGRTDLYSAGIILFEMLSGAVPFAAADVMEVLRQHVREPPPDLPVAAPVSELLGRLLAKSPDDRYVDAPAALTAVRQAAAGLREKGSVRVPTVPRVPDAPKAADTPRAAAVLETMASSSSSSSAKVIAKPAASTAPATHETEGGTRARIELSDEAPCATPVTPSMPFGAPRRLVVGVAVGAATILGFVAAGSIWSSTLSSSALDAAVAIPAPPPQSRADPQALAAIDAKLAVDDRAKARTLLVPLLQAFPDDPAVLWRAALAEGKRGRYSQTRADWVLRTMQLEPQRIEDTEVQEFILRELERSVVPDTLLDVVLEHGDPMREDWTRALLGSRRTALPHAQRERLLVALRDSDDPLDTWDPIEHRCLDLWQAGATDRPCTLYADTLDTMEAAPSASYRRSVMAAEIPAAGADETKSACADLERRRDAVLRALKGAQGDPDFVPRGYAARPKTSKRKPKKRFRFRNFFP